MHAKVQAALACPDCCGGLLSDESAVLACTRCGRRFEVDRGVPRLLPSMGLGADWDAKQQLGEEEYQEAPDAAATAVARRFAEFAVVDGLVLDVGSGVEPLPSYMEPGGRRMYVGLDPLVGTAPREFDFVQGLAEHLPFRDATFDGAISATMLDHVPDPARVLEGDPPCSQAGRPPCRVDWHRRRSRAPGKRVRTAGYAAAGAGLRELVRTYGLLGLVIAGV